MFKLDRKLIVSASVAAAAALFAVGCVGSDATPSKSSSASAQPSIDGGVFYPVTGDKTGPYHLNTKAIGIKINAGRVPTANELEAWNTDIMPDGTGLPEGSGSVADGSDLYDSKCVMCHGDFGSGGGGYPALAKGNAYTLQKTLKNQRTHPDAEGPVREFGSYWPQASTLFWYIKDAMPHAMTGTLTDDETYAITAYVLNINEMKIDGVAVDYDYVLDREKFLKIVMPNVDGFEPNIDGPNALQTVRRYYADPANFGGQKVKPGERCMHDCQKPTAEILRIQNGGIKDFIPPMTAAKDLPKEESKGFDVEKSYEANCIVCHGSSNMGAPVLGDKKAWAAIAAKGMDTVYKNGIDGIRGMPAKGGSSVSDAEFKTLVDYIFDSSK
ncbi:MAG: c-type cytochrome [Thiovulaceae bacterium]|nr:c-type cytochrome [Sulfurimonadaceae bacterium]